MRLITTAALTFVLMSGIAQAQDGIQAIVDMYAKERAERDRGVQESLANLNRGRPSPQQEAVMDSQRARNDLQIMQMLGPQQGMGLPGLLPALP